MRRATGEIFGQQLFGQFFDEGERGQLVGEGDAMAIGAEMKQKIIYYEELLNLISAGRFLRIAQGQKSLKPDSDL